MFNVGLEKGVWGLDEMGSLGRGGFEGVDNDAPGEYGHAF